MGNKLGCCGPGKAMLPSHVCGAGEEQGERSYSLRAGGSAGPDLRNTELWGFVGHVVNIFRD